MKRFLLIILFITLDCSATDEDRAMSAARKAILQIKEVKQIRKKYTKKLRSIIPLDKKTMTVGAIGFYAATRGEVSTRPIKKMNVKILDGNMRPDVVYNFKDNRVDTRVQIDWEF